MNKKLSSKIDIKYLKAVKQITRVSKQRSKAVREEREVVSIVASTTSTIEGYQLKSLGHLIQIVSRSNKYGRLEDNTIEAEDNRERPGMKKW